MKKAFTIVELSVVIAIILLLLGLVVLAFRSMTKENKLLLTESLIFGTLRDAQLKSVADKNLVAVRFMPATFASADTINKSQIIRMYSWNQLLYTREGDEFLDQSEAFEPYGDVPQIELPNDIWVCPSIVRLSGIIDRFEDNAKEDKFLNADDFLVIFFDGKLFMYGSEYEKIYDYSLAQKKDTLLTRYRTNSLILYKREPFVMAGKNASDIDRKAVLEQFGNKYVIESQGHIVHKAD